MRRKTPVNCSPRRNKTGTRKKINSHKDFQSWEIRSEFLLMMFLIYPTHSQHHILLLSRLRNTENMCVCEWAGEEIHPRNNRLRRRWLWTPRLETFFVFVNIYNYLFCGRPLPLGICRWQIACRRHQGKASGVLLCWLAKPSIHAHSPKPRLERGETPYTRTLDKPPERRFCLFIIHGSNTRLIITPINDVWKARKNRPSSYSRRDVGTSGDKNGSCSVHQRWTVLCASLVKGHRERTEIIVPAQITI